MEARLRCRGAGGRRARGGNLGGRRTRGVACDPGAATRCLRDRGQPRGNRDQRACRCDFARARVDRASGTGRNRRCSERDAPTATNKVLHHVRSRIPPYRGYTDEAARHDSDKRVRAIVGEALSDAQVLFVSGLDAESAALCAELLYKCMFTDQTVIRRLEHEEEVMNASTVAEFAATLPRILEQFARRHAPAPAAG